MHATPYLTKYTTMVPELHNDKQEISRNITQKNTLKSLKKQETIK